MYAMWVLHDFFLQKMYLKKERIINFYKICFLSEIRNISRLFDTNNIILST